MSTAIQERPPSNTLALVNSFYGPGATACWYLTCLSCWISWTLHPKKRTRDAITSDFIAIVTFPTVASSHLITQILRWPSELSMSDDTREQVRASLAASLIITETYFSLCIILILPGLFARTPKRLCLLASTGVFCVASETYLYFTLPSLRQAPGVFERSFIIDSFPLLVLILILASVLVILLLAYLYLLIRRRRSGPTVESLPALDSDTEDDYGLASKDRGVAGLTLLSLPFLFISMMFSSGAPAFDLVQIYWAKKTSWTGRRSFIDEFFPRTDGSIMDLDQAVALLAGMTILGFSLYSTADATYKRWCLREEDRQRLRARTLAHLRECQERYRRHRMAIQLGQRLDGENIELGDLGGLSSIGQRRT